MARNAYMGNDQSTDDLSDADIDIAKSLDEGSESQLRGKITSTAGM